MRYLFAFLWCCLVFVAQPALASDGDDIRAANARWSAAIKAGDMAVVEQIVAPEFALTWGSGGPDQRVPRAAWLANLKQMTISDYRADILDIKFEGDRALATVDGQWTMTSPQRSVTKKAFKLRDIWVRGASGWQVAGRHMID